MIVVDEKEKENKKACLERHERLLDELNASMRIIRKSLLSVAAATYHLVEDEGDIMSYESEKVVSYGNDYKDTVDDLRFMNKSCQEFQVMVQCKKACKGIQSIIDTMHVVRKNLYEVENTVRFMGVEVYDKIYCEIQGLNSK